jgi:hypothetical protein
MLLEVRNLKGFLGNLSNGEAAKTHRPVIDSCLHLAWGLPELPVCWVTSACPECLLLMLNVPEGRFVSRLTLKFPHCVSCTVIHSCVLSFKGVHLQIDLTLGIVSGEGESPLHCVWVVHAITIGVNLSNPLQPFPWSLLDPLRIEITGSESKGCTGESQGPSRLHQVSPDSTSYNPHWTPTNTENPGQETITITHPLSLSSCPLTSSISSSP